MGISLKNCSALVLTGMICLSGCGSGDDLPSNPPSISSTEKTEANILDTDTQSRQFPDKSSEPRLPPVYDFQHMIDPFVPLVRVDPRSGKVKETGEKTSVPMPLLESLDINTLRLTAVVFAPDQKIALLEEPDGKGHEIRIGMRVGRNRAQVTGISRDRILLREISPDGSEHLREVTLHEDTEE